MWIEHLYLFAKDFQHEYERDLFIYLYIIFVKKLLIFISIYNVLMYVSFFIENNFNTALNDINIIYNQFLKNYQKFLC